VPVGAAVVLLAYYLHPVRGSLLAKRTPSLVNTGFESCLGKVMFDALAGRRHECQ
jgi:hypothetical protein